MKPMDDHYLFVYGTLRRAAGHPMHGVMTGGADFVDEAAFPGRLYLVRHYPGMVAADDSAERVRGEVYRLRDESLLEKLDVYEGIAPDSPRPHEYVRQMAQVQLASGEWIDAWVYLYNWPVTGLQRIVSGDFLSPPYESP